MYESKEFFEEVRPGHFTGNYGMYQIHIINIEAIQLGGPDGVFLSEFCRDIGRLADRREIEKCNLSSHIIDKLIRGVKMRMTVFEGKEEDMVPVADVTEIVRPQLEKAWNDGIEKGIEKGITQTAKRMKAAGVDRKLISKSTGLSKQEIEKL